MNGKIPKSSVKWLVIVDGDIIHEADTKPEAKEWVETEGVTPDRIASKIPLEAPIGL